jgi:hypothetical protein
MNELRGSREEMGGRGTDRLQGVASLPMFLARGKVEPVRVDGEPVAAADGTGTVRALLHYEGDNNRTIAAGSCLLRVVE